MKIRKRKPEDLRWRAVWAFCKWTILLCVFTYIWYIDPMTWLGRV